jgi:hypothetical protein
LILGAIVVAGLAAGAAAAWVSGWRPGFLATDDPPVEKPAGDKPGTDSQTKPGDPPPGGTKPGDAKPGDPKPGDPPKTPPGGEVTRACFAGNTEVKAGTGACGFALDAAGAVTFKGEVLSAKLGVGGAVAQRLVLYPFSSSGRFVFFRACDSATGGRCTVQRLADTKNKKLFEVKGGNDGFAWVAWSPKESVGLLGYREGGSDTIGAVATADGSTIKSTSLGTGRNRYALIKQSSMRWRNEESFTVEVKLCSFAKGRTRNKGCEDDDDVRFRRRTIKLSQ